VSVDQTSAARDEHPPRPRPGSHLVRRSLVLLLAAAALAGLWAARAGWASLVRRTRVEAERGFDLTTSAAAGSRACFACHPDHGASWRATYHRTMTRDLGPTASGRGPGPREPAGPFDGRPYRYGPVMARPWRDEAGHFYMTFVSDDAPGAPRTFEVSRAVGSHRYQQYFTKLGASWMRLPLAYHIQEKRWLHLNGAFLTADPAELRDEPGAPAPTAAGSSATFGGRFVAYDRHVARWNDNCIFCHNVGARPGWDAEARTFASTVDELGIACESCHGPGEAHAAANRDPVRRWAVRAAGAGDPTIVNPARLSPGRAADVCGHCHGQRITDDVGRFLSAGDPFIPGQDLGLYSAPLWASTSLAGDADVFAARFWNDGTPRLSAYEYQGWLQSRCSQVGALTCTSCHGMHEGDPAGQLRPVARGDGACAGCHAPEASAAPSAAGAPPGHSRHPASVTCVDCHMPRIVYGMMDVLRSHRIEVPRPREALLSGRPDACRLCHVTRDGAWAQEARARLWGTSAAAEAPLPAESERPTPPQTTATALTWSLAGDPVTRAVALAALGRWDESGPSSLPARLAVLAEGMGSDPYPALRRIAARSAAALLPAAASTLRAFDPTGPAVARRRALAAWRAEVTRLRGGELPPPTAQPGDLAALRREADTRALDIGE